jgi:hypothetical protein
MSIQKNKKKQAFRIFNSCHLGGILDIATAAATIILQLNACNRQ